MSANVPVCPPTFEIQRTKAAKSGHGASRDIVATTAESTSLPLAAAIPNGSESRIFQNHGHLRTFPDGSEAPGRPSRLIPEASSFRVRYNSLASLWSSQELSDGSDDSMTTISDDFGIPSRAGQRFALAVLILLLAAAAPQQAWAQAPPRPPGQNPNGMHVFIWAGLKSHLVGQHDYPQFLADWSKVLTEHGAVVDGALHPPSSAELEGVDVVVIYKGDAGYYVTDGAKAALEAFVKRGGGLVSLHDSLCGPDPAYFASLVGGAKKHGEVNYTLGAPIAYTVVDKTNPIMKDMSDLTIFDESFYNMTWADDPKIHVLATNKIPPTPSAGDHKGEVVPQMWTYEHTLAGGQAGARIRMDAGSYLREFRQLPDSAHAAARHRVGRQQARR